MNKQTPGALHIAGYSATFLASLGSGLGLAALMNLWPPYGVTSVLGLSQEYSKGAYLACLAGAKLVNDTTGICSSFGSAIAETITTAEITGYVGAGILGIGAIVGGVATGLAYRFWKVANPVESASENERLYQTDARVKEF